MIDSAALDLLEGGGKSAKFTEIGDTVKGAVVSAESRQQTDYTSGEPLTWDDGNPRMQLVITLATDQRDPDDPTDDGHRNLYAKGKLLDAIRQALKAAGVKLAEGGTLAVQYTGDGTPKNPKHNPPKEYVAEYAPPSKVAGAASLLGDTATPTPQAPQQAAPAAPAAQPAGGLL